MKKILVVDDSALMRRVLSDIIIQNEHIDTPDTAKNGAEALELVLKNQYDVILLDINMPKMNGIEFLKELKKLGRNEKVLVVSTDTLEGVDITMKALELGALDFIKKPASSVDIKSNSFKERLMSVLLAIAGVTDSKDMDFKADIALKGNMMTDNKRVKSNSFCKGSFDKVVVIASSTGGPNALHSVIPKLPADLNAPVILVQHMPKGFTENFASRLDSISEVRVCEASDNDLLKKGYVYIARGGSHLKIDASRNGRIYYTDEPLREGVRPCANYAYESLIDSDYQEIICVVMTGMGQDGMEGIKNLSMHKKVFVISQDEETSTIYGMPKAVFNAGLSDVVVPLEQIAAEIVKRVGN